VTLRLLAISFLPWRRCYRQSLAAADFFFQSLKRRSHPNRQARPSDCQCCLFRRKACAALSNGWTGTHFAQIVQYRCRSGIRIWLRVGLRTAGQDAWRDCYASFAARRHKNRLEEGFSASQSAPYPRCQM